MPVRVDLVYAEADHTLNMFKEAIYPPGSALWLHKDMAKIVLVAAQLLNKKRDYSLLLYDGLRPVDAQTRMQQSEIVQAHPEWQEDGPDRLLSPPGMGGHPRGMAVDLTILNESGIPLNMGTNFDELPTDGKRNKAARNWTSFGIRSEMILANRKLLTGTMIKAARVCGHKIQPLPSEWWDFRFPKDVYEQYDPVESFFD